MKPQIRFIDEIVEDEPKLLALWPFFFPLMLLAFLYILVGSNLYKLLDWLQRKS
jgi:hypothetical protein